MSGADHRAQARLDAQVRRQAAEIGLLREAIHRLEHAHAVLRSERDEARAERDQARAERDAARSELATALRQLADAHSELDQLRHQHADLRRQMADLLQALQHGDERLRAVLRREFAASSERLIADDGYIPEILASLREQQATVVLSPEGHVVEDAAAADPDASAAQAAGAQVAAAETTTAGGQPAAAPAQPPAGSGRRRPATAGGRKPLPEDIERRNRDYTPPADHPALRNALGYDIIGSTTIERWHVGKLDLHIDCVRCPVVRLTLRPGIVMQETLSPPAVIERGQVSDELLVQSAVDKVVDHLPAYRQEQRAQRVGVCIPRAKLCRWHIALAGFLHELALAIFNEIAASPVIGIDDSVHRRLVDDRHVCRQSRLWAASAPAGIFYLYSPTREGRWITDLLAGYRGGVMGDAFAGHGRLLARNDIIALFCWAHVRRKFHESADTARRRTMLGLIAELYGIESGLAAATPAQRVFARSAQAKPILARIKAQLDHWHEDPQVLPRSGIGRATAYARKLWPGLERYVTIGSAPIDNNATERAMRPVAMHRKNSLFSSSDAGAEAYATLLTVTQTAILHRLDPIAYLNDVIVDLHFHRRPLSDLTPQAYARRAEAGRKRSS